MLTLTLSLMSVGLAAYAVAVNAGATRHLRPRDEHYRTPLERDIAERRGDRSIRRRCEACASIGDYDRRGLWRYGRCPDCGGV